MKVGQVVLFWSLSLGWWIWGNIPILPNVCWSVVSHQSRNTGQNQRLSFCFCVRGARQCFQDRDLQSFGLEQNCFVSLKLFLCSAQRKPREKGHPAASQITSKELGSRRLCLLRLLSGRDQATLGGSWQAWKGNGGSKEPSESGVCWWMFKRNHQATKRLCLEQFHKCAKAFH